ncbi:MAG: hypothetical protein AB1781_05170 [Pseudomonadota bacterium]
MIKKWIHALLMGAFLTGSVAGFAHAGQQEDCSKIKDPTDRQQCEDEQDSGE